MSKIEWTGETWNPLVGCTIHSAGCKGCYAMKDAYRLMHNPHPAIAAKFAGTAKMINGHAVWTGRINFDEATLLKPLRRRTPTTYFVNSMSDLFHQAVTDGQIDQIFAVMALCPQHTFQVLTKRADRMRAYFAERWQPAPARDVTFGGGALHIPAETRGDDRWDQIDREIENISLDQKLHRFNRFWTPEGDLIGRPAWPRQPLPNVWLGVSVEDQRSADERIPDLLNTPGAIRFLSCEPLIGPLDLMPWLEWGDCTGELPDGTSWGCIGCDDRCAACPNEKAVYHVEEGPPDARGCPEWMTHDRRTLDWIICGGESGARARPMHPDWARSLRDQCAAAGVPFFFKQWGEWAPGENATGPATRTEQTAEWFESGWHFSSLTPRMSEELHCDDAPDLYRLGKRGAGRWLDGVEHSAMPPVTA